MSTNNVEKNNTIVSKHPQYDELITIWAQMRATSDGSHKVKEDGTTFLPKTDLQDRNGVEGTKFYNAYKSRAVFYEFVKKAQQDALGLLHNEPTIFELPKSIEYLANSITSDKDDANSYLRRIHEQQLITGRCGLLLDVNENSEFVSVLYSAERIVNWDSENAVPRWIILDDSEYIIDYSTMKYNWKNKYILLALNDQDQYFIVKFDNWSPSYLAGSEDVAIYPEYKGNLLNAIPFTFCNSTNVTPDIELPPFLSLSNVSLALYRGDADYRQALFMQGQATLMFQGLSNDQVAELLTGGVGANSYIALPDKESDAKFLEVDGAGINEMRESQENLKSLASSQGIEFYDKSGVESGAALITRATIRTASLRSIAETSAMALRIQFEHALKWMNVVDIINITPNIDFITEEVNVKDILDLFSIVQQGGMTLKDYHKYLSEKDVVESSYDDWMKEIETSSGIIGFAGIE